MHFWLLLLLLDLLELNLQNVRVEVIVVSESLTLFICWVSLVKLRMVVVMIKSQLFNLDALHFRLVRILLDFLDSYVSGDGCSCNLTSLPILPSLSLFGSFALFSGTRHTVSCLLKL